MSENGPTGVDPVPPPATLLQMMTGYWVSQALYVAAKLGVADLLADGPRPVEALAAATQTNAPSLRRVLRALASVGVFTRPTPITPWLRIMTACRSPISSIAESASCGVAGMP